MVGRQRLHLYRQGVNALHGLGSHLPWLYLCPICATGYGWGALLDRRLTMEHVPPLSVGGRAICLTCKTCNNRAGTALEHHLEKRESAATFARALVGEAEVDSHPAILHIGDHEQRVEVTAAPEEPVDIVGVPEINPPGTSQRVRDLLDRLSESGKWEGQKIRLTSRERYHPWRVQVALLKAGFLAAFAKLGYRYALHPNLQRVREQIQHPDEQLLPPFGGRFNSDSDTTEMWHFQEPTPALLVQINRDFVYLPNPGAEEASYERVLEQREKMLNNGRGRPLEWPTTMEMALDEQ